MNARQALKIVSQKLEDAMITIQRAQKDIKAYNECIDYMIRGGNPCDYCEDSRECGLEAMGHGCDLWMLRYDDNKEVNEDDQRSDSGASGGAGGGSV